MSSCGGLDSGAVAAAKQQRRGRAGRSSTGRRARRRAAECCAGSSGATCVLTTRVRPKARQCRLSCIAQDVMQLVRLAGMCQPVEASLISAELQASSCPDQAACVSTGACWMAAQDSFIPSL